MRKTIRITYLLTIISCGLLRAQTQIDYPHYKYSETLNNTSNNSEILERCYLLTYNNASIEPDQNRNGFKEGS